MYKPIESVLTPPTGIRGCHYKTVQCNCTESCCKPRATYLLITMSLIPIVLSGKPELHVRSDADSTLASRYYVDVVNS